MTKKCFTLVACDLQKSCAHAQRPNASVNGWFQPKDTGEYCDSYQPASLEIDHHDEIMAKMGAHQCTR